METVCSINCWFCVAGLCPEQFRSHQVPWITAPSSPLVDSSVTVSDPQVDVLQIQMRLILQLNVCPRREKCKEGKGCCSQAEDQMCPTPLTKFALNHMCHRNAAALMPVDVNVASLATPHDVTVGVLNQLSKANNPLWHQSQGSAQRYSILYHLYL